MRLIIAFFLALTVVACDAPDPTFVNEPGTASPFLGDVITEVVSQANADRGKNIGDGVVVDGARSDGNTVFINFLITENLAEVRSVSRAQLEGMLGNMVRADACRDPAITAFIGLGGRMQLNFRDPNRRPLAAFLIDRC